MLNITAILVGLIKVFSLLEITVETLGPNGAPPTPSSSDTDGKNSLHDSGFVSPANVSLPLAKLIPILTAQVNI